MPKVSPIVLHPVVRVHPVVTSGGWTFGWDALAAIGTLILAVVTVGLAKATFRLARQAQDEARAVKDNSGVVKEQVELQRQQIDAAQKPFVVPAPSIGWVDGTEGYGPLPWAAVLPVKNVGLGPALNVGGIVNFPVTLSDTDGGGIRLIPTSLATSETAQLRLDFQGPPPGDWAGVKGKLD